MSGLNLLAICGQMSGNAKKRGRMREKEGRGAREDEKIHPQHGARQPAWRKVSREREDGGAEGAAVRRQHPRCGKAVRGAGVDAAGLAEKEQEAPDGQESIWTRARREEIKRITARAAQDASRTLDLMRRRVENGRRNLDRVEQIDALLLGEDRAEGLVTDAAGVVIGELREQKDLAHSFAEQLREERRARMQNIPADFSFSLIAI